MNDEQRWNAVLAHDASSDGDFVYAVRSTGIYCRPSCPSRRPGRGQVQFYGQPTDAEQAGFRPCRRCHPAGAPADTIRTVLVERVCQAIDARPDDPPSLAELGSLVGLSPFHLQRTFKQALGVSPRKYAEARRIERLKTGLREGQDVSGAIYEAGFGSSSQLYESAARNLGMTPATYRQAGKNMAIRYTLAECHLGQLLVAATDRGVCAVRLGNDMGPLEDELRREYGAAEIRRDDVGLGAEVDAVLARMAGPGPHPDLPLDVRASAFQIRVWDALRAIPWGETRSYGELALALGQPTAARAVARACATNPVAVVIPCHRVVAANGGLSGYRWGVERKRALLTEEAEGVATGRPQTS